MIWDIITFGDVKTLTSLFNAISVIFQDGGYMAAAGAVALMAVIGGAVASLTDGAKDLPFPRILVGILLFAAGFSTLTSVSIENRYDGTVNKIDHIPVAVAMPASLISQIGLWMTENVETAFGSTGMQRISEDGYLSPLSVLANLRARTYAAQCISEAAQTGDGINLCLSLANYASECTLIKANRDNAFERLREGDALTEFGFNSKAWGTRIINASGIPEDLSCTEGYNRIVTAFNGGTWDGLLTTLERDAGVRHGESTTDRVSQALAAIGADASRGRNLMQAMVLLPNLEQGEYRYLANMGASDMLENLTSSIQQRNYIWSLQGEMWTQMVNQALTVFEALIYAITPFIGLMLLTGTTGVKVGMLYMQLMAVLQLIPPLLVICSNIILIKMGNEHATLLAMSKDPGSVAYMMSLTAHAQELLGLGGMLSSTIVPALAMALVTGSSMGLMSAMKQMAASPKDTDATPESVKQGNDMINLGAQQNGTYYAGLGNVSGQDMGRVQDFGQSNAFTQATTASAQRMHQASENYSRTQSQTQQATESHQWSRQEAVSAGEKIMQSDSAQAKQVQGLVNSLGETYGLGHEEKASLALSAGVKGSTDFLVAKASMAAEGDVKWGRSSDYDKAWQAMEQHTQSNEWTQSFQDSKHQDYSQGQTITQGDSFINQQQQQEMSAFQEQKTATEAYQTMQTAAQGFTLGDIGDKAQRLAAYANDAGVQQRLNETVMAMPEQDRQQFLRSAADFTYNTGTSDLGDNGAKLMAFAQTQPEGSDFAYVMTGVRWTPQDSVTDNVLSTLDQAPVNNNLPTELSKASMDTAREQEQAQIQTVQQDKAEEGRTANQDRVVSGSWTVHDHKLTGKVENAIDHVEKKGSEMFDTLFKEDPATEEASKSFPRPVETESDMPKILRPWEKDPS